MSGYRIREARRGDAPAIGALWRELMAYHYALDVRFTVAPDGEPRYARHVIDTMRSHNGRVLVAEDAAVGDVIAYLIGELQTRPPLALPGLYGFVSDIYVQEAWRGLGVGRALFEEMRSWFILRKASAIELYISEANPAAAVFWRAMGLQPFLKLMHLDL